MCCRGQGLLVRKTGRVWLAAAVLAFAVLEAIPRAIAGDRTNVPLKNWGGFSEFRDAVYDDLERLVTAGLARPVLLDTRPLGPLEGARVLAPRHQESPERHPGGPHPPRHPPPPPPRVVEGRQ